MVRKQLTLGVLFLLMGFRGVALAQISDGGKAPQVPWYGLAGDTPDDGAPGGDNPACQDLFYATSNAECSSLPGGGDAGSFGPVVPTRPGRTPMPAPLGFLPGENSINFPAPPLMSTLWDMLGLPTVCDVEFGPCVNVGPNYTSNGQHAWTPLAPIWWDASVRGPYDPFDPIPDYSTPPVLRRARSVVFVDPPQRETLAQAKADCFAAVQLRYNAYGPMNGLTSDPGYSVDYGTALYTDKGGAVLNPPGASNGTAFQGAGGGLALWQGKQADYNFCMEMYNILP